MSTPSIYINLEDDVSKIVARLKHQSAKQVVLVCPKRCFLFNDSINLRLLKKQADLLGKEIFILTMDEKGQLYAKEAGFPLKFLPKVNRSSTFSDIKISHSSQGQAAEEPQEEKSLLKGAANEIKQAAKKIIGAKITSKNIAEENPAVLENEEEFAPDVKVKDTLFPPEVKERLQLKSVKKRNKKGWLIFTGLLLAVAAVVVFIWLPQATIAVYPKTEPVTRDMEVNISSNATSVDAAKFTLPAVQVSETENLSDKFQSQGKKQVGNKAAGTVKIYNFTKLPINLKSSTTVLTDPRGKTYVLLNDVSGIKPTTYKNSKTKEVDESSLSDSVQIVATSGGDDYNLPSGTRLEITNQVFGSKPQYLYAKTDSEISGGTTRYLSIISQDDIDNAKATLQDKALSQIQASLKTKNLVMAEKSYNVEISEFNTDAAVNSETPTFSATLSAKITGLAYNPSDLDSLISQRIEQTLSSNKTLQFSDNNQDGSVTIKTKTLDIANGLAVLTVHFEGLAVFNLNLDNLSPELVGKTQNQAYEILKSKTEINKVEITLAPVWQKTLPLLASKIKLSSQIEASQ